jgi:ATP-dependent exoDNAse (exonuclease V) alpha subunit
MINGARKLPTQHITIRVPWHDNGWQGKVCNNPCDNTSCMVLPRISASRDDNHEKAISGQSIEDLPSDQLPPCVDEHGTIMADFPQALVKNHPYKVASANTHGHMDATPYTIQPFSAAAIPFRWMLMDTIESTKNQKGQAELLQLGYQSEREPKMKFETSWVQEGENQRIILDTFFSAVQPEKSLIFLYAKRTPMCEDSRRTIVGVGRVNRIGNPTEYRYQSGTPTNALKGYLWERDIEHSIRSNSKDGFLLPYQQLLELAEDDANIDLVACTAFAPNEYFEQYSYGSELLAQDGAIASLLAIEKSIKAMRELVEAPWDDYLQWIDKELNRLWEVRGAFPGLGPALNAFGLPHGNLLAWHLCDEDKKSIDPWPVLEATLADPSSLPDYLKDGLGETQYKKWKKLPEPRRALIQLLSRFNLNDAQAMRWYQPTEREKIGIVRTDAAILENPYCIYEDDCLQEEPISFGVIDRGLFPPENLRADFPIPEPSIIKEAIDQRRVRALMVKTLEEASIQGHTLLPKNWLVQRIRETAMKPECPLDADVLPLFEDFIAPLVVTVTLNEENQAYQLDRYVKTAELIKTTIGKRIKGKANSGDYPWLDLVNKSIDNNQATLELENDEMRARQEKAAALEVLYRSRVSVLMGSAGTGKSTLIKALCAIDSIRAGGILLLAPTGKARVRLEQASGMLGYGQTIAQFLNGLRRYDSPTGRYFINTKAPRSAAHKSVVIDECSMLTEEQLAGVLDAVKGVDRLILVGDPKQLPPIGAGRPYVDIVQKLVPENIDSLFPKIAPSYAELTVTRRQKNEGDHERADILLANYFSGRSLDAGADEVWSIVTKGQSPHIELIKWNQQEELQTLLIEQISKELKLLSCEDEIGFERSIGGTVSNYKGKQYVFFNTAYKGRPGAAESAENWQILSPIRPTQVGVEVLNRKIQTHFRKNTIDLAARSGYLKLIPKPVGPQCILWGDKIINVINSSRRRVYPDKDNKYVANGDIGIVTGYYKKKGKKFFNQLEVELSSQPGYAYKYWPNEFDSQEASPPLELAYALTIHKTQGSEFGTTFLVVPNPCRLLTREMLYTALTRQQNKVIILHQGEFSALQKFSHEEASEVARRMTNLFKASEPCPVVVNNQTVFLDKNLIYKTDRGELVRSKSEWIIADKLYTAGIDYHYEHPLQLGGIDRYPDFTVVDDDNGVTWYWEHNGLMNDATYKKRWQRKLDAYRKQGIRPYEEGGGENGTLLITEENEGAGLDAEKIKSYISVLQGN